MAIPPVTPYSGEVANPNGSQDQQEFTTNMFNQLSFEKDFVPELNASIDAINETATQVDSDADRASASASDAQSVADYVASTQFVRTRIGNISDYAGDTLTESERFNIYQYPDNSEVWYGVKDGEAFPVTIPANPELDEIWINVTALSASVITTSEGSTVQSVLDSYGIKSVDNGEYAPDIELATKYDYVTYSGKSYFATNPPYTTTATTPDNDTGNLFVGGYVNNVFVESGFKRSFASVSEAIANCPPVGYTFTVDDYYGEPTPNNSGVLFFKVVPAGTGADDGGKYIDVDATRQLEQNLKFPISVTSWGAAARGSSFDNKTPIQNAIDYVNYTGQGAFSGGPALYVPPSSDDYYCSESLILKSMVKLYGVRGYSPYSGGSALAFPSDTLGIAINDRNSIGINPDPSGTGTADGSTIEGLEIKGGGGTNQDAHGILGRVRHTVQNCWIYNFAGEGHRISSTYPGLADSNVNNFIARQNRYESNGRNGLYITGSDANIGYIDACDSSINFMSGFYDSSFLGCTFSACHTQSNGISGKVSWLGNRYVVTNDSDGGSTTPGTDNSIWELNSAGGVSANWPEWVSGNDYTVGSSYRVDSPSAKTVLMGCYTEGGQVPDVFEANCVVIGGQTSAFPQLGVGKGSILRSTIAGFSASRGYISNSNDYPELTTEFGTEGETGTVLKVTDTVKLPSSYRFRILNNDLVFNYANATSYASGMPFWLTTQASARQFGRVSDVNNALVSNRLWLGNNTQARHINFTAGEPATGEYALGDFLFNRSQTISNGIGFACTTAGTAGIDAVFTEKGD